MKTINEILDLADGHVDLPSQEIIDALYQYEFEKEHYRKALEEIASNESGINAERADGIAIAALAMHTT